MTQRLVRCALSSNHHQLILRHFTSTSSAAGFSYPGARSLEQIVKLELLKNESRRQICRIWEDFHVNKDDAIATTLTANEFYSLVKRAAVAPYFIVPVYRQEGFFNMLCQFQQSCFLVTYLDAFKENPNAAPPCVVISLYDNLVAEKNLTLVRADVINMLDKKESQLLLQQLLISYQHDKLYHHVDKFNNTPDQFDFEAYRLLLKDISESVMEE
ncbi:unnamed protein product [Peronospora farinosa]|uniref:ATP synthase mitochondrial F1 complex assembly factor 1 n=1 Tax=Peronospora farinosa TaxID=134698 RepID=A0AAV0UTW0_9STRA|nr:unnamed protein product [Peronospora farinosa]CAI5739708.1 unnamed protein product [Peronospora farinosa]